jgi:hypothetical protein
MGFHWCFSALPLGFSNSFLAGKKQPYFIDDRKRLTIPTKETIKREQEVRKMLADKFNNGFSVLK